MNLGEKRLIQGLTYTLKILSLRFHPLHNKIKEMIKSVTENQSITTPSSNKESIMLKYVRKLTEWNSDLNVSTYGSRKYPPWINNNFKVDLSLNKFNKEETPTRFLKRLCLETLSKYDNKIIIYTDGSKKEEKTGWGFYVDGASANGRMRDGASIFTAECTAILEAIKITAASSDDDILICSDSQSALNALLKLYTKNAIISEIKDIIFACGKKIDFLWVPSHIGLKGNNKADEIAKNSLHLAPNPTGKTTFGDWKNLIKSKMQNTKDTDWTALTNNKLKDIKTKWGKWERIDELSRKEAVVITRLRIGHTRLTHGHLIEKTDPKICECGEEMTFNHLYGCNEMKDYREMMGFNDRCCLANEDPNFLKIS